MAHAGESSYPFSTSTLATEEQWAAHHRSLGHGEGVVNTTLSHDAPNLQVTPGTSGTVIVAPGDASINGFTYRATLPIVLNIPTNATGSTARNDTVVLEANQSTNEMTAKYLGGASTPPGLTRLIDGTWQMPLAAVQVPAKSANVTSANITDRRQFVQPQGIVMGNGDQRPIGKLGQFLYVPDGLYIFKSTGPNTGAWTKIWPVTIDTTGAPTANTSVGAFSRISTGVGFTAHWKEHSATEYSRPAFAKFPDGLVVMRGLVQATVTTGNDEVMFKLPTGYRIGATQIFKPASSGDKARVDIESDGQVRCRGVMAKDDYVSLNGITFVAES